MRHPPVLPAVLLMLAMLHGPEAVACKVAATVYDLQAYLAAPVHDSVVFTGHVTAVEMNDQGKEQRIAVETDNWWMGAPVKNVVVFGSVGTMRGTDCEGTFDFQTRAGANVLIVAHPDHGKLHAWPLSRELDDGKLPPELARLPRHQRRHSGPGMQLRR